MFFIFNIFRYSAADAANMAAQIDGCFQIDIGELLKESECEASPSTPSKVPTPDTSEVCAAYPSAQIDLTGFVYSKRTF